MRLTQTEVKAIKIVIATILGDNIRIWLFGSRVDDTKRGGDIDLMVDVDKRVSLIDEVTCKMRLKELLDIKVDLLIKNPGVDKPIYHIAMETGVML